MIRRLALCVVLVILSTLPPSHAQVSLSASSKPSGKPQPASKAGTLQDGNYRNPFFGFSYKLPYGWVDRTSEMSAGAESGKSMVLLSAFERPPQATGESVNSAVVIAAESVASYPGLKSAEEYFGPLTELTAAKGFKVTNEPYDFTVATSSLVRGDFSRDGSSMMYQSSLVLLKKGYILSFTFLGGSEGEVNGLIENLSFLGTK